MTGDKALDAYNDVRSAHKNMEFHWSNIDKQKYTALYNASELLELAFYNVERELMRLYDVCPKCEKQAGKCCYELKDKQ